MYKIRFYKDKRGRRPIVEYIKDLARKTDKDSRIKLAKINDYMQALQEGGISIGEPFIKRLDGDIWELRPLRDRILFAAWDGTQLIMLHHFMKATRKTPPQEIQQAKRNLMDIKERGLDDE
ncbi:MAG: type II toxin-antitoxin system RelE/ParE family toxin [Defluviitaleaceae bacterium]|nr:type II toxin-antitoxin system RelE/ParE family toxin [Defluviitaleaceae bacterium]